MRTGHFEVLVGRYRLTWDNGLLGSYYTQRQQAALVDELSLVDTDEHFGMLSVGLSDGSRPLLILKHGGVIPWDEDTLSLAVVLVPETDILFAGEHRAIWAYDLRQPTRLWTDTAEMGFLGWQRHGEVVVMSAELELAAWDLQGHKLWSTFVEPPYDYVVADDTLHLTVMDVRTAFPLTRGPSWGRALPWLK